LISPRVRHGPCLFPISASRHEQHNGYRHQHPPMLRSLPAPFPTTLCSSQVKPILYLKTPVLFFPTSLPGVWGSSGVFAGLWFPLQNSQPPSDSRDSRHPSVSLRLPSLLKCHTGVPLCKGPSPTVQLQANWSGLPEVLFFRASFQVLPSNPLFLEWAWRAPPLAPEEPWGLQLLLSQKLQVHDHDDKGNTVTVMLHAQLWIYTVPLVHGEGAQHPCGGLEPWEGPRPTYTAGPLARQKMESPMLSVYHQSKGEHFENSGKV
jgi:hypothetical protein